MLKTSQGISSGSIDENIYSRHHAAGPSLSPAVWSSVLMAIGGMGDALLYAYLPVKGEALGLSLFTIGLLLSINKFSRFFSNRWIAFISDSWGIKNVLLLGVVLSILTTITYAFNPSVWIWVLARIAWGASYSALRFSTIQYAGNSFKVGSALGISRSIQDLGPLLAYWVGPAMLASLGASITFSAWAALLVVLLPVFYLLPALRHPRQEVKPLSYQRPQWIDVWVFASAFVVEGLLIVGVSRMINITANDTDHLLLVTSLYISLRRLLNIVIAPASGWLSDQFGFQQVFHLSCWLIIIGAACLATGFEEVGIITAFVGSATNSTLVPMVAIALGPTGKSFDALTRLSTSRDLGSAFGSLSGLWLLSVIDISIIFVLLFLILVSLWSKIRKLDYQNE